MISSVWVFVEAVFVNVEEKTTFATYSKVELEERIRILDPPKVLLQDKPKEFTNVQAYNEVSMTRKDYQPNPKTNGIR